MLKKPTELFRGLQTVLRNEMVKEKVDMKRKKSIQNARPVLLQNRERSLLTKREKGLKH